MPTPTLPRARLSGLALALCALGATEAAQAAQAGSYPAAITCPASPSWLTDKAAPSEVPNGTNADFCNFYQFSWQWFLNLVAPSATASSTTAQGLRRFQDTAHYPILEANGADGKPENSCDATISGPTLRVSLNKTDDPSKIPDRTGQAGTGGQGIYDQNGNVVFYDVRFSRNLCNVGKIQSEPNFPGGTVEMKTAWRQMTPQDNQADYFIMKADIDGMPGEESLGMVGFHIAVATPLHPEMIWASYEHRNNAPPCGDRTTPAPEGTWSFMNAQCASDPSTCTFNKTVKVGTPTGGTPTDLCTAHTGGMAMGDPKYQENALALIALNSEINAMLTALPDTDPMAVWKNYINIGALWLSDSTQPSATASGDIPLISNQRGSLRLANTVMETDFQDGFSPTGTYHQYSSNCFGCHEYTVDPNYRNTGPHNGGDVSHIFQNDIVAGQCKTTTDVNSTSPIADDKAAQSICASTCASNGGWSGNWTNANPGGPVCGCCNP